jgi:hypothetical protein
MKQILLFLITAAFILEANAQQALPGGVKGLYLWSLSGKIGNNKNILMPKVKTFSQELAPLSSQEYTLNNNPAIFFDGRTMQMDLDLGKMKGYCLFTVCQPIDTLSEQAMFSIENDSSSQAVLTNKRTASLTNNKYLNYESIPKKYPAIYSYSNQNSRDTKQANYKLRVGQVPRRQSLPIQALRGIVPEIMLYDHNLSYKDRLKIETYLAIKYGISLDQTYPLPYLNSRGDTIWDPYTNAPYAKNIAGLGRDDVSGLHQVSSESVQTKGLLKISNTTGLADKDFVIWGDNGGILQFSERNSLPSCLGRDWRVNSYKSKPIKLNLASDDLALDEINPLGQNEFYWLMIDISGTGKYPSGKTKFIRCDEMINARDSIRFKQLTIDADSSGADVFTLITMPALFVRCSPLQPDCHDTDNGSLEIEIAGGTAPYQIELSRHSQNTDNQSIKTTLDFEVFENIKQGAYRVVIIDALGQTYTSEIWVSNRPDWENQLSARYQFTQGESIELDASHGMANGQYNYNWTTPGGETIYSEKIQVTQPGNYYCTITNASGCSTTSEIAVSEIEKSDIEALEVFPNPVTDDWFVSRVSLNRQADVTFTIADQQGRVLKTSNMKGQRFYWYNGSLSQPGLYFLTVSTGNSKKTMKLVVVK